MPKKVRRVAVIGAGPAGAIATDALVFERRDLAGGTWVFTPELPPRIPSLRALVEQRANAPIEIPKSFPTETPRSEKNNSHQLRYSDTSIHETLHSNITPEVMAFTQEPIPQILSDRNLAQYGPGAPFRHRELIREWVEGIFTRGGHDKGRVVSYAAKGGAGEVKDYWWQESLDAVIAASGHFYLPYIPDIPGLVEFDEKFPGRIKHSKHFSDSEEFRDKVGANLLQKVIVIGGFVSAFDALHDIQLVSQRPVIASLREPLAAFGWAPFTHPDIGIKPQIINFCPKSGRITFSDGSTVDGVDAVVFATGYDFSFPFLPGQKVENRRVPGLYQHIFNIDDPTLAFVGMVTGGFTFRVFEWQAVAAARVFAGHGKLPPRLEQEKWEKDRLVYKGDGVPFFTLVPDFEQYFDALRTIAGEPFDPKWLEAFSEVLDARIKWWKETKKAEDQLKLAFKSKL
ncbi:hypothetical protein BDP81DRAFT_457102 [Colletotrichum phormii]|uniref:Thiol-specific monooxygenase n=1 Tax=Colletotrichum phormii TaxID=359342 RepID=A0AAJ0EIF8_9PEZI|nr:uncharacterized protein BDP81DRAFT_457102 [Colletotrichum phormii]KAK1654090.1 hypothetical protein BDP81DRAFT_457102 [Colletotrichum phormii]